MKRLVIKRGDQIVRREIGGTSLTVGRDPSCELHFDDPSLSRRHGAFEPTESGVRYVDLQSRNGSWVNQQKVKEADLEPGDTVRMGSLLVTYAYDPPPPPPPPPPRPDPADDTATVIASAKAPAPRDADSTVLLSKKTEQADPSGTRILRAEPPTAAKKVPRDTARLGPEALRPPPPPTPLAAPPALPAPAEAPADDATARWSWSARHGMLTLGVALVVYVILALPLVRTLGNALREESLRRGRALLDLLEATNASAVAEGRSRDLHVDLVTREERVKEALLLDVEGKVLAPSSRVDERLASIEGIEPATNEIRTFYLGRRSSGDYVMVKPILDRGQRAGIAVLVYEVSTASGSWAVAILFLGFLVMLLAVLGALLLGKRFTLEPLDALRDDVEAVVKGDAQRIPLSQGFTELSEVARSINRLIERAAPAAAAPAAAATHSGARTLRPAPGPIPAGTASRERAGGTSAVAAVAPAAAGQGEALDGARFWADSNFIVIRAEPQAAEIVGSTAESMEGHHVIEAVKDQRLLGVVLDCLNSLEGGAGALLSAELPGGTVEVGAAREGDRIVVSLKRTS